MTNDIGSRAPVGLGLEPGDRFATLSPRGVEMIWTVGQDGVPRTSLAWRWWRSRWWQVGSEDSPQEHKHQYGYPMRKGGSK